MSTTATERERLFGSPPRVVVLGASSRLGASLVRRSLNAGAPVLGTYRRRNPEIESLEAESRALRLRTLDVLDDEALEGLGAELGERETDDVPLAVVYCCGLWHHGVTADLRPDDFDRVVGVGLRAPLLLTAALLRHVAGPLRIILVTGLGGGRNAIAHHALYAVVTHGVYSLVRSVGAELAGTAGAITGVALGLFDKGQGYLHDVAERFGSCPPGDLREAREVVHDLIHRPMAATNGSVIELAGGLTDYREVIRYLEEERGPGEGV